MCLSVTANSTWQPVVCTLALLRDTMGEHDCGFRRHDIVMRNVLSRLRVLAALTDLYPHLLCLWDSSALPGREAAQSGCSAGIKLVRHDAIPGGR